MRTVEIVINKDGAVIVSAHGFKGTSCKEATSFLDSLFKKVKVDYKDCYYEIDTETTLVNSLPSGFCG